MRNIRMASLFFAVVVLLLPHSLSSGASQGPYSTLVIAFVGETDRPVFPIVITTSKEEGEWYLQHFFQEPSRGFDRIYIVPISILDEVTKQQQLRHQLKSASKEEAVPKTSPTVRFIAGTGHDYVQTMFSARVSEGILQDIAGRLVNYRELRAAVLETKSRL